MTNLIRIALMGVALALAPAHASTFPDKPVKMVVPFPPGGGSDTLARIVNKKLSEQQRKDEIEKGFSAVKWALGGQAPAPFFRFPALQHPPEMVTYLGSRNIGIFSCDLDSFDFKARNAQTIIDTVMRKVEKNGKGIILMHDFQQVTGKALPQLLKALKADGYKVVHITPKAPAATLGEFDEVAQAEIKGPAGSGRPTSSVVRTISTGQRQ